MRRYICSECGAVIESEEIIGAKCPVCHGEVVRVQDNPLGEYPLAIVINSDREK